MFDERHRQSPSRELIGRHEMRVERNYQQRLVFGTDETLDCASFPGLRIRVSDLFL